MTQPSPALTVELAAQLARIALNGITREYPTYSGHIVLDAADLRSTRELHPAFYGCFDWHSAVHSHWLLARLLRLLPALPEAGPIRSALNDHLTEANLRAEAAYFAQPGRHNFNIFYLRGQEFVYAPLFGQLPVYQNRNLVTYLFDIPQ